MRPTSSILSRIRAAISQATNQGRVWRLVRLLILEASALRALDNQAGALRSLRRALELGEPGRMVRSFVDEGPHMLDLIEAILDEERRVPMTTAIAYLEQILAAAGRVPGAPSSCKTQSSNYRGANSKCCRCSSQGCRMQISERGCSYPSTRSSGTCNTFTKNWASRAGRKQWRSPAPATWRTRDGFNRTSSRSPADRSLPLRESCRPSSIHRSHALLAALQVRE